MKPRFIPTGDGHVLYFERYGNPASAHKAIYLHGGPGAGCGYTEQDYFDPDHFDIVLFDQRWAPKSRPRAFDGVNTIDKGVEDVATICNYFGFDRVSVGGGSYGTALATLFAVRHPDRVRRLFLRAQFFADAAGARHITEGNPANPAHRNEWFDAYRDYIPDAERVHGLARAYYDRLRGDNAAEAAKRFMLWDTAIATVQPSADFLTAAAKDDEGNLALARTWFHFVMHEFNDDYRHEILDGMRALDIPVDIIHGREDHICPVENAVALANVCRDVRLHIVNGAGHSGGQPKSLFTK